MAPRSENEPMSSKPCPTDIALQAEGPAFALSFEERCERLTRHVLSQTEHREIRIAVLGFCRERRSLAEVELFVQDLPEFGYETQSPYLLIRALERAGGVVCVELDDQGEPVTPERKEGLDEDEIDDLVFELDFETTDAGVAVYERLTPGVRLADLLESQSARKDTYCELLEYCLTPRSREEVERLLEGRDILWLDAPGDQPLKPSVFIDRLERSGVLVWRGKWVTGAEGRSYLVSRGLLAE